jgi:ABC-type transport system involved in multi-copper enzyme maturation permease subunit
MTVLTMPARANAALRPVPWRKLLWVTWRQHRATMISVPAVLGAIGLFLLIAGLRVHHDYALLTACHPFNSSACQALNQSYNATDWTMANTLDILMQFVPALIGAFAGGSLLARELETGTYRYSWTQGIGRIRLTIAKLAIVAAVVTITAAAFSELFTWFFKSFLAPDQDLTVLSATVFDTHPVSFAAWTLAAFSIGALAGMLLRRTVPAIAVTLGVYIGLSILTWTVLRKNYLPPVVGTGRVAFNNGGMNYNMPWVLHTWTAGHTSYIRYIPVSRFWPMQFIEAGWLLALSILLGAATVWLVRRRAA